MTIETSIARAIQRVGTSSERSPFALHRAAGALVRAVLVTGAVAVLGVGLGVGLGTRNHSTSSEEFPNVASWPGGPINARPAALVSVSGFSL